MELAMQPVSNQASTAEHLQGHIPDKTEGLRQTEDVYESFVQRADLTDQNAVVWRDLEPAAHYLIFRTLIDHTNSPILSALLLNLTVKEYEAIQRLVRWKQMHPASCADVWQYCAVSSDDVLTPSQHLYNTYAPYMVFASQFDDITSYGIAKAKQFLSQKGLNIALTGSLGRSDMTTMGSALSSASIIGQDYGTSRVDNHEYRLPQYLTPTGSKRAMSPLPILSPLTAIEQEIQTEDRSSPHLYTPSPSPKTGYKSSCADMEKDNMMDRPASEKIRSQITPQKSLAVLPLTHPADRPTTSKHIAEQSIPAKQVSRMTGAMTSTTSPVSSQQQHSQKHHDQLQIPRLVQSQEVVHVNPCHKPWSFAVHFQHPKFPDEYRSRLLASNPLDLDPAEYWMVYGNGVVHPQILLTENTRLQLDGQDSMILPQASGLYPPKALTFHPVQRLTDALRPLIEVHNMWAHTGTWYSVKNDLTLLQTFERVSMLSLQSRAHEQYIGAHDSVWTSFGTQCGVNALGCPNIDNSNGKRQALAKPDRRCPAVLNIRACLRGAREFEALRSVDHAPQSAGSNQASCGKDVGLQSGDDRAAAFGHSLARTIDGDPTIMSFENSNEDILPESPSTRRPTYSPISAHTEVGLRLEVGEQADILTIPISDNLASNRQNPNQCDGVTDKVVAADAVVASANEQFHAETSNDRLEEHSMPSHRFRKAAVLPCVTGGFTDAVEKQEQGANEFAMHERAVSPQVAKREKQSLYSSPSTRLNVTSQANVSFRSSLPPTSHCESLQRLRTQQAAKCDTAVDLSAPKSMPNKPTRSAISSPRKPRKDIGKKRGPNRRTRERIAKLAASQAVTDATPDPGDCSKQA